MTEPGFMEVVDLDHGEVVLNMQMISLIRRNRDNTWSVYLAGSSGGDPGPLRINDEEEQKIRVRLPGLTNYL